MIGSIPSPTFNTIELGPLSLNIYGLMIALGVVAAVWLFGRRLEEREIGTRDDASAIAVWAVLAGVIGARLYHVVTDYDRFENDWGKIPAIWEGGLGIPGGLLLGIPVGLYVTHKRGIPMAAAATAAAPAIPLAQAIGRWGNYFNQELYGGPTDLLWALEIDEAHLEAGYAVGTTFHPTFLYESLWSLALVFVLLWIDRRFRPAPGQLMVMYLMGYGAGRFWVEGLRIDPADEIAGLRVNQWVALAAVIGGAIVLAYMRRHPIPEPVISHEQAEVELDLSDVPPDSDADADPVPDPDPDTAPDQDADTAPDQDADTAPDQDPGSGLDPDDEPVADPGTGAGSDTQSEA
ncbi:MAG: prolipoprotein diacylglyceryl transferase [Actinobacteria bacterium]|nr:MAG: prolipoprotein diacylglyceryl transferase [Actinomycetota bacterium]